uniref:RING-type domain-containing protein n=1 Tax=Noccaea caerulescens TaxID=107243 RepID=A0A1J3IP70_NOCCA
MNLPSSTATPTPETSTSPSSDSAAISTEICDGCGSRDSWVIHAARLRCVLHFFCTHCLLRNHPQSFCPSCFVFYDSSPPHASRRVTCSKCGSHSHTECAGDAKSPPYLCPPCRDDTFSFFSPIIGSDGSRSVDKSLSEAFLCAAKIAASSMTKAVYSVRFDAERRGKEAALAKKRAREAIEEVIALDDAKEKEKEKARSVIPKLKEASVELSGHRDQKPKLNGAVKEKESSATTKNNGGAQKQNPAVQLAKVKQEGDTSK